jgi:hypothetical protein
MSIKRVYNAKRLNEIINDKSVFELVAPFGVTEINISEEVSNVNNFCLLSDEGPDENSSGGFLVLKTPIPFTYECHTQFLECGRGTFAYERALEAIRYMFCQTDCLEIWTKVPKFNVKALALCKAVGFELEFSRDEAWKRQSGTVCALDYFTLRLSRWSTFDSDNLSQGQWFHKRLETLGVLTNHTDDFIHDRVVGASLNVLFNGQIEKALQLYNKWALMAQYEPLRLVTLCPLVVNIGNALLEFNLKDSNFSLIRSL